MTLAPIILFVYNRSDHTRQTIEALQKNALAAKSELIVFSDGAKTSEQSAPVEAVRNYLKNVQGFKNVRIVERDRNFGLANNIIDGVTTTLNQFDTLIVLEDDLVVSPWFLDFMNEGLQKYKHTEEVISIHGYCIPANFPEPAFFIRGADCWGWATWKRGWKLFNPDSTALLQSLRQQKLLYAFDLDGSYDFSGMLQKEIEGKVNSWAIRWHATAFVLNKLTLYPGCSLVQNIGGDGSGTHAQNEVQDRTNLCTHKITLPDIAVVESKTARSLISQHYNRYQGIKSKLKKILKWGY
jgi:glycosyltransferase involved in cell wall biosynthesis